MPKNGHSVTLEGIQEKHTIRGLAKMDMFITVTLIVYLGMAKAKIDRGVTEHLGRLYA